MGSAIEGGGQEEPSLVSGCAEGKLCDLRAIRGRWDGGGEGGRGGAGRQSWGRSETDLAQFSISRRALVSLRHVQVKGLTMTQMQHRREEAQTQEVVVEEEDIIGKNN